MELQGALVGCALKSGELSDNLHAPFEAILSKYQEGKPAESSLGSQNRCHRHAPKAPTQDIAWRVCFHGQGIVTPESYLICPVCVHINVLQDHMLCMPLEAPLTSRL